MQLSGPFQTYGEVWGTLQFIYKYPYINDTQFRSF